MKKLIFLIPMAMFAFLLFTGQVIDNVQKNSKSVVDGSYIYNIHKLQMWYQQKGNTLPSSLPLVGPLITRFMSLDGIDQADVRVFPSAIQQTENSIGINPSNSNNLMISVNELSAQPYFFTTNGGVSWFGAEANPNGFSNYGDPVAFFNVNGKAFWSTLANPGGIGFASTTNNGATWVTLANGDPTVSVNDDKQHATCDLSGIYPNNVYTAWTDFTAPPYPLYINRSTNDGVSWGTKINISLPNPHFNHGVTLASGPNGEVYVAWADYATGNLPETGMGFTKSTNGGLSYNAASTIFTMSGIRVTNTGVPAFNNTRVNSFPKMDVDRSLGPRRGWIYIVYPDQSTGDADVYLRVSTNGGTSWSAAIRVNGEPVGNLKQQWMPSIGVDATNGVVGVSYYSMDTTVAFLTARYIATSSDGGTTWDRTRVSDVRFTPSALPPPYAGGYCGDYYETAAGGGNIWACWSDNRSGTYNAYTSKLSLGPSIAHTMLGNTEQTSGTIPVNCVITPAGSAIVTSLTKLFVVKSPAVIFDSVQMTNSSGNNWTSNITLSGAGIYKYYIRTVDNLNRSAFAPVGAPVNYYSFTAAADTVKPVIATTPLGDLAKTLWPVAVTASVTDNLGVDSAWVRWYKNTPSITKQFKLINTIGNTYSAVFNSINSDVVIGDYIYYKIFAQDNSSNHNRDSSALYNFKITSLKICEDFSGGVIPPNGWLIDGIYWLYSAVSGYGTGTGSVKFDFFNASVGTTQSLTSLTFDPTVLGDSIKFDHAYATYTTEVDQLAIESSVNSGTTWNTIITLNGGTVVGTGMVTAPPQTAPFTPIASQWATKKYALPVGTNKVRFRAISAYGNNLYIDNVCQISTAPAALSFNLTALLQGFYNGVTMVPKNVTVELRNQTAPYTLVESKTVGLNSSGVGNPSFTSAVNGTPYYIVLKFNNGIETWSATPQTFSGSALNYDFTTAASKAYGSNMVHIGTKWCVYVGDVNQDGAVDLLDMIAIDNDVANFVTGNVVTDLNGDLAVDLLDMIICDNNVANFVSAIKPPGALSVVKIPKTYEQMKAIEKYMKDRIEQKNKLNEKVKKGNSVKR